MGCGDTGYGDDEIPNNPLIAPVKHTFFPTSLFEELFVNAIMLSDRFCQYAPHMNSSPATCPANYLKIDLFVVMAGSLSS